MVDFFVITAAPRRRRCDELLVARGVGLANIHGRDDRGRGRQTGRRRPMADRGKEWLAMNGLAIVLARGRIKDLAGRKKDLAESSQLDRILSTAATSADDIVNNIMNHECGIRKPSS
jgi:hypothetical protein